MSKDYLEKITEGREYRNIIVSELETRSDDEAMIVEGYATKFNEAYRLMDFGEFAVDEIVSDRAFDKCDISDVIMQYDHEGRVFARNKNGTLTLEVDEKGLRIKADLSGTEIGRQLYQEIKGGYTDKMSFGFVVRGDERTERTEDGKDIITRTITDISKLYDVSAVSIPANDATEISARNFSDGVIAEIKAERQRAEERQKQIERIKQKGRLHND